MDREIEAFNTQFAALDKACRAGVFSLMEAKQIADSAQIVADLINAKSEKQPEHQSLEIQTVVNPTSFKGPAIAAPPIEPEN